jgi:hypothetical protein
MLDLLLPALCGLGALAWIRFFVLAGAHRDWVVRLRDLPDAEPPGGWPRLAVVFAARDEAAGVEAATRSLLASDYPDLEVIAVDDRSGDATGAILDRLAAQDPRLSVVHVTELPEGWLGKTHALQAGARRTRAAWILFTDADVVFAPGALRRAVAYAATHDVDHVTVTPELPTRGLGERVFLPMFQAGLTLHSPGWKVDDPEERAYLGIGAFNLVSAEALGAIGGFERIRLSVDDDMQLGRALKWSGRRSKVLLGAGAVSVRWHVGLGGMIRGLEKNFFAGANFRLARVLLFAAVMVVIGILPFVGLFVGPPALRVFCGAGVAVMAILVHLIGGQSGLAWYHGALMPLSALANLWALLRSTFLTLRRGGVSWRGHLYPLPALRAHVEHREHWMRELWLSTR